MTASTKPASNPLIKNFKDFADSVDYSLMNSLHADPEATSTGDDVLPRQVFSGHYVPVKPTPIKKPEYIGHSPTLFSELGLSDELALDEIFSQVFSGDLSNVQEPMKPYGWATGYALSIYGTEYTHQCPFGTGNGYGDGRAISIYEGVLNGQRWEMQLKGGGPTPYCRGGDGRAVLRSSVREFLVQDYMHALGVPTSRSLTLYVSHDETVTRPWYSEGSRSANPDIMMNNPVAISTRVAPSFLRIGQLELFARRVRNKAHPKALEELQLIVSHLIEREYKNGVDQTRPFNEQLITLATLFQQRFTSLVAHWLRVGYCQGNFNSDNCAVGGFTLDYGPFGFCEAFDTEFQPWTGGGEHFSFFNQPAAAETNFHMFWTAVRPLLVDDKEAVERFDKVRGDFADAMKDALQTMWASKLGLREFHPKLFTDLIKLMERSEADYTLFFRELSHIPEDISPLKKSFYAAISENTEEDWQAWLNQWRELILENSDAIETAKKMKQVNPKYTWREWLVVPAYEAAMRGDYTLIKELQAVFNQPYDEQSQAIEDKYYQLKPKAFFNAGGVSHYSCSS